MGSKDRRTKAIPIFEERKREREKEWKKSTTTSLSVAHHRLSARTSRKHYNILSAHSPCNTKPAAVIFPPFSLWTATHFRQWPVRLLPSGALRARATACAEAAAAFRGGEWGVGAHCSPGLRAPASNANGPLPKCQGQLGNNSECSEWTKAEPSGVGSSSAALMLRYTDELVLTVPSVTIS